MKRGPRIKTHCRQGHEIATVGRYTSGRNGRGACKACQALHGKKQRAKKKVVRLERVRKHPICPLTGRSSSQKGCICVVCRATRSKAQRAFRKRRPEVIKANNLKQFGLSYSAWQDMVAAQNNRCAVCDKEEFGCNAYGRMSLAVDHDHTTGKVRALLCHRCNRALGLLGDDAVRVENLAKYRRRFS